MQQFRRGGTQRMQAPGGRGWRFYVLYLGVVLYTRSTVVESCGHHTDELAAAVSEPEWQLTGRQLLGTTSSAEQRGAAPSTKGADSRSAGQNKHAAAAEAHAGNHKGEPAHPKHHHSTAAGGVTGDGSQPSERPIGRHKGLVSRSLLSSQAVTAGPWGGSAAQPIVRRCGTEDPPAEVRLAVQRQVQRSIEARSQLLANARATPITINVYVTINRNGAVGEVFNGDITNAAVTKQVAVMNAAYSPSQIRFVLANVTRVRNPDWWDVVANGTLFNQMKATVRQGNYADLNIVTTQMQDDVLGSSSWPWGRFTKADAVVIHPWAWVGGYFADYKLGATVVHEVGHWLGLFQALYPERCPTWCTKWSIGLDHPFIGGCTEPNDHVSDTAQAAAAQYACPNPAPNSCPNKPAGQPALDPIHNYMNYSPDACMTGFTPGQALRMGAMWDLYRAARYIPFVPKPPSPPPSPPKPPPRPPPPPPVACSVRCPALKGMPQPPTALKALIWPAAPKKPAGSHASPAYKAYVKALQVYKVKLQEYYKALPAFLAAKKKYNTALNLYYTAKAAFVLTAPYQKFKLCLRACQVAQSSG